MNQISKTLSVLVLSMWALNSYGIPTLSLNKTLYAPNEPIVANFSGEQGNAADWIGIYPTGSHTPDNCNYRGSNATTWLYVNGTQTPGEAVAEGSVSFGNGLGATKWPLAAGNYIAYFLRNDGYCQLGNTVTFTVGITNTAVLSQRYDFEEGEGTVVADLVGGHDGTLGYMDSSNWVDGFSGRGLYFDGSYQYVGFEFDDFDYISTRNTIALWVNVESHEGDANTILEGFSDEKPQYNTAQPGPNNFWLGVNIEGKIEVPILGLTTPAISKDEWHHIAFTSDWVESVIYIDGEVAATGSPLATSSTRLSIGTGWSNNNETYFHGKIDELRIYIGALDKAHIQELYEPGVAKPPTALAPVPSNGTFNVSIDSNLSWGASADSATHDLYFGTSSNMAEPEFKGNQTGTSNDSQPLAYGTTYYWRVDEKNRLGTTTGNVWSFTTEEAPAPATDPVSEFTVATWNVLYGGNVINNISGYDAVEEILRENKVDILLMQETYGTEDEWKERMGYKTVNTDHNFVIFSRFPIEVLSQNDNSVGVKVELSPGRKVVLYDVWYDHRYYLPEYACYWKEDIPTLISNEEYYRLDNQKSVLNDARDYIDNSEDIPVIWGGDHNSPSHLDYIAANAANNCKYVIDNIPHSLQMIEVEGFTDSYRAIYPDPITHPANSWSTFYTHKPMNRIDLLYHKGSKIDVIGASYVDFHTNVFPSDHGMIAATYQWNATLSLDKSTYSVGKPIVASFTDGPGNPNDWIGIYSNPGNGPSNCAPGPGNVTTWLYVNGTQSGSGNITEGRVSFDNENRQVAPKWPLPAGDYIAHILKDNGYCDLGTAVPFRIE